MRTDFGLKSVLLWCVSLVLLGVLAASFHIAIDAAPAVAQQATPTPSPTPRCGWGENCEGTTTKSSTLNVEYVDDSGAPPIGIPATGRTSWEVVLKYQAEWGADCDACDFLGGTNPPKATFDIDFTATGWTNPPLNIVADSEFLGIYLCASNACNSLLGVASGTGYTIGIDFPESVTLECPGEGDVTYWIDQVFYKTIAVPAGHPLNETCTRGMVTLPVSQTFSTGDNGEFECEAGTCGFGPSLDIQY